MGSTQSVVRKLVLLQILRFSPLDQARNYHFFSYAPAVQQFSSANTEQLTVHTAIPTLRVTGLAGFRLNVENNHAAITVTVLAVMMMHDADDE